MQRIGGFFEQLPDFLCRELPDFLNSAGFFGQLPDFLTCFKNAGSGFFAGFFADFLDCRIFCGFFVLSKSSRYFWGVENDHHGKKKLS